MVRFTRVQNVVIPGGTPAVSRTADFLVSTVVWFR